MLSLALLIYIIKLVNTFKKILLPWAPFYSNQHWKDFITIWGKDYDLKLFTGELGKLSRLRLKHLEVPWKECIQSNFVVIVAHRLFHATPCFAYNLAFQFWSNKGLCKQFRLTSRLPDHNGRDALVINFSWDPAHWLVYPKKLHTPVLLMLYTDYQDSNCSVYYVTKTVTQGRRPWFLCTHRVQKY